MLIPRRTFLAASTSLVAASSIKPAFSQTRKLRFGVGPLLPTADDTIRAYSPLFDYLAKQLGMDFSLVSTTDWAGMAVAMGSGQLDLAWMGPWGYIIANNATNCQVVATVKYDERPTYRGIVIAKPNLNISEFPGDTKGMSMSFADVGSTSGWLVPTYYAKEVWKIDPRTFWSYHEGATHAANEVSVSSGQSDLATDFDRNRNAMIEAGKIKAEATKIVWTSAPLPNDAIVLAKDAPVELVKRVQTILTSITPEQAKTILPPHYTGFVESNHKFYETIGNAGVAVGKIKRKA